MLCATNVYVLDAADHLNASWHLWQLCSASASAVCCRRIASHARCAHDPSPPLTSKGKTCYNPQEAHLVVDTSYPRTLARATMQQAKLKRYMSKVKPAAGAASASLALSASSEQPATSSAAAQPGDVTSASCQRKRKADERYRSLVVSAGVGLPCGSAS